VHSGTFLQTTYIFAAKKRVFVDTERRFAANSIDYKNYLQQV